MLNWVIMEMKDYVNESCLLWNYGMLFHQEGELRLLKRI